MSSLSPQKYPAHQSFLAWAFAAFVGLFALGQWTQCTRDGQPTQDAKSAVKGGIQIADDTCKVAEGVTTLPEWLTVICTVDGIATKVTMPKAAWYAAKAATRDAGADSSTVGK